MLIPWYLMAAYAYYELDDPFLSDGVFDNMAKQLHAKWDQVEHFHKHLLTRMDLLAGTYLGKYPLRVQEATKHLLKNGVDKGG